MTTKTTGQNQNDKQVQNDKKVILKFSKPWGRYAGGDIAGFSPEKAEEILSFKHPVAEKHK